VIEICDRVQPNSQLVIEIMQKHTKCFLALYLPDNFVIKNPMFGKSDSQLIITSPCLYFS